MRYHLTAMHASFCLFISLLMLVSGCQGIVYDANSMQGSPPVIHTRGTLSLQQVRVVHTDKDASYALSDNSYLAEVKKYATQDFPQIFVDRPTSIKVRATLINRNKQSHIIGYIIGLITILGTIGVLPSYEGETTTDTWLVEFLAPQSEQVIHSQVILCSHESSYFFSVYFPSAWILAAMSSPHNTTSTGANNGFERILLVRSRALVWAIAREVAYHHESH